jgi:hypothetical protein
MAKKYSKTAVPLMILGSICFAGGCALALKSPSLWKRANDFASEPQKLTLAELAENGPGDARHVVISDFMCANHYWLETTTQKGRPVDPSGTAFRRAWIPLFSKTPGINTTKRLDPEPRSFQVLLQTPNELVGGHAEIHMLSRRSSMPGLVVRLSETELNSDGIRELTRHYPETNLENCWVVVGYSPHHKSDAPTLAYLATGGAGVCLLFGIVAFHLGLRSIRRTKPLGPPPLPTDRAPQDDPG